ncbi:acetate/propionate family kinase [Methylovirgula sp. 4M-Z18]|uniref:acetate/propionate family kinase n=1 Tax=Methylovirgula sp. 4M-Z18 TaxID=2293567 RepID=UPI000E2F1107|nr:acetate/propionate family kinase [Methylovirgula sp. 4M-Z18]RFB76470.1 acetate/propionate family kinase [Methylovirgula sp. 4M-Z18]
MKSAFLILNAGSSSLKFALYEAETLDPLLRGEVANLRRGTRLRLAPQSAVDHIDWGQPPENGGHEEVIAWLENKWQGLAAVEIVASGHRIVHGGRDFSAPIRLGEDVLTKLDRLSPLAPAHEPHNLAGIRALARAWPGLPQVGCFDTAFHRSQPHIAQIFGIPRELTDAGMLRYGFHGLSYEYIAGVLPQKMGARGEGRIIVAHLGNGASLCGLRERRSVATTMGYTAMDGLVMSTRCGAIDPGLVLALVRERGYDATADLLNNRSGLLGVSGLSGDIRELEASENPCAKEALDLFVYRVLREAGSLIAVLGGFDAFVFTGGIGEHSSYLRQRISDGLAWTGARVDPKRNAAGEARIHVDGSPVELHVIATNEELPIARAVRALIG